MSAKLHGTVGIYASTPINIVVRFFTPGTQTEKHKSAAPTDDSGVFDIYDAPVGTYDVGIKSGGYLSLLKEDQVFTEGETTDVDFGTFVGIGGDIIDNDWVTSSDTSAFTTGYNKKGACYGYAGNWLIPQCPSPPPGGACYGYIIS